eukprot:TRINITY_DN11319_c0_g1_i1.p1 TRINITY_DN11319_c0_g1~~TRINITY_DN11319_c0_g1_i1.p1  ORF type:complete len:371 (+),score=69.48 TRINITY_DN11319_c0_g1_i1:45-1115(+)
MSALNATVPVVSTAMGYAGVAVSVLFFGSFGVLLKSKRVQETNVDPLIFQLYYSFGISVINWLILSYNKFVFTWFGAVLALMWVPASVIALYAVNFSGLAIAQGVWSGVTIFVSFIVGVAFMGDQVSNLSMAIVSLLVLVVSVGGLATSGLNIGSRALNRCRPSASVVLLDEELGQHDHQKLEDDDEEDDMATTQHLHNIKLQPYKHDPDVDNATSDQDRASLLSGDIKRAPIAGESDSAIGANSAAVAATPATPAPTLRRMLIGLVLCVFLGIENGCMMLPLRFTPEEARGVVFVCSFAIFVFPMTLLTVVGYFLIKRQKPVMHFRAVAVPGMLTGVIWSIGNLAVSTLRCRLWA